MSKLVSPVAGLVKDQPRKQPKRCSFPWVPFLQICGAGPPAAGMAAALGHSQRQRFPKGQAPVLASKPFPNNPGTREIRKKLWEKHTAGTTEGLETTQKEQRQMPGAFWGGLGMGSCWGCKKQEENDLALEEKEQGPL